MAVACNCLCIDGLICGAYLCGDRLSRHRFGNIAHPHLTLDLSAYYHLLSSPLARRMEPAKSCIDPQASVPDPFPKMA